MIRPKSLQKIQYTADQAAMNDEREDIDMWDDSAIADSNRRWVESGGSKAECIDPSFWRDAETRASAALAAANGFYASRKGDTK